MMNLDGFQISGEDMCVVDSTMWGIDDTYNMEDFGLMLRFK